MQTRNTQVIDRGNHAAPLIAVSAALLIASPAFAQQAAQEAAAVGPQDTVEEILVTAQRREQRLQDVPIAITALTDKNLQEFGVRGSEQLTNFTPNLTWNQSGSVGSNVGLRGIIDSGFSTNQVGSVGIVVDEVSLNSPVLNTIPLFDLERVEVLRGPQVTLYGRSTTGGAVNFYSKRPAPGDEANGFLSASYGNFSAVNLEGAITIPLGERAALRAAGLSQTRDGIYSNPTQNRRVSDRDRQAFRLWFAAEPVDNLSVAANLQLGRDRGGGPFYKSVGERDPNNSGLVTDQACLPPSSFPGVGTCVGGSGFKDSPSFRTVFGEVPSFQKIDVGGGLLNVSYQFSGVKLASISSYLRNKFRFDVDIDGSPSSLGEVNNDTDTDQFSQEMRLSSAGGGDAAVNWILGGYYFHEKQNGLIALIVRENQIQPFPGFFGPPSQLRTFRYLQDNDIYSAYGQLDWKFAENWELTVGGRYSDEKKSGTGHTRWVTGPAWAAVVGQYPVGTFFSRSFVDQSVTANIDAASPFGQTWKNSGGKIGLSWHPGRGTLVYANFSRGFKGGTFNFLPAVRLDQPVAQQKFLDGVRPEKLNTYEIGAKLELAERRLQLNAALFWNSYKDQQQIVFRDGGFFLLNAASSTIKGAELELTWTPVAGLLMSTGIGLLDTKYDDFKDDFADYSGQRVVSASDVSWNGLIQKTWPTGNGSFKAQTSFKYFSAFNVSAENLPTGFGYSPVTLIPSQFLLDARLAYAFGENDRYEVAVFGQNITDRRYCTADGSTPVGNGQCGPNEPRAVGLLVRASF